MSRVKLSDLRQAFDKLDLSLFRRSLREKEAESLKLTISRSPTTSFSVKNNRASLVENILKKSVELQVMKPPLCSSYTWWNEMKRFMWLVATRVAEQSAVAASTWQSRFDDRLS